MNTHLNNLFAKQKIYKFDIPPNNKQEYRRAQNKQYYEKTKHSRAEKYKDTFNTISINNLVSI